MYKKPLAIGVVCLALVVLWLFFSVVLNRPLVVQKLGDGVDLVTLTEEAWNLPRPILPSPQQVLKNFVELSFLTPPSSNKSLVYHAWVTFSSTLLGFLIGVFLGIALAVFIVYNNALEKSLMPWLITSQTIPILSIAPMVVVIFGAVGLVGLLPKAVISAYLSFFPITIGMVRGLRSADSFWLELARTYNMSGAAIFWKIRLPSSLPYLFVTMKIAIAASLVGAIVGELPTGAVSGLGVRLLVGSYYGQTVQIWSALFAIGVLAFLLILIFDLLEKTVFWKT